jgi:hypothetical protein
MLLIIDATDYWLDASNAYSLFMAKYGCIWLKPVDRICSDCPTDRVANCYQQAHNALARDRFMSAEDKNVYRNEVEHCYRTAIQVAVYMVWIMNAFLAFGKVQGLCGIHLSSIATCNVHPSMYIHVTVQ